MGVIRVLLADDHRAFLEALVLRLGAEPDIEVVSASTNGADALRAATANEADVALLDIDLAGADGVELGQALKAQHLELRLVAVTLTEDVETAARAIRAGFVGWVPKDRGVAVLVEAVKAVCRGEMWIRGPLLTQVLQHILREDRDRDESRQLLSVLTARELDVLRWMTTGASRTDIAEKLFISPNTVRTHMQSILAKLDVHSSLAAVALARRAGIE